MTGESSQSAGRISGGKRKSNAEDPINRAIREEFKQSCLRIDEIERQAKVRKAEERELTLSNISEIIKRFSDDPNSASAQRSLKLEFRDKISQPVAPGEEIKGEGDVSIEVVLVDCLTGEIVDIGPEAYANVEVVLLKGDFAATDWHWTSAMFDENIVREVEGKTPFLVGNVHLEMHRGVAVLREVKFKHDTIKIKPREFRLGARVTANGDRVIKEAISESFNLVYYHRKYVKKYSTPLLSEDVYRLVNIAKNGKTAESLHAKKILTVEDFLIQLLIDPEKLEEIFKLGKSKWEATVKNARACRNADSRMYCYINPDQTMGVVFTVLGQIPMVYFGKQLVPWNMLTEVQKVNAEKMLPYAYKNWESTVVAFSDDMSLQQHAVAKIRAVATAAAATSFTLDQATSATSETPPVGGSSGKIPTINAVGGQPLNSYSQELSASCCENSPQLDQPLCPDGWFDELIGLMSSEPRAMADQTSEMDQPYD